MNLLPLIGFLWLVAVAVLYVKGKEDAETFDAELRYVITRVRYCPATDESFKHFREEFKRLNKMSGKNREKLDVAYIEFKRKFAKYF